MSTPAAGWYPNPDGNGEGLRYWDGSQWTEHYHREEAAREVEPIGQSAPDVIVFDALDATVHADLSGLTFERSRLRATGRGVPPVHRIAWESITGASVEKRTIRVHVAGAAAPRLSTADPHAADLKRGTQDQALAFVEVIRQRCAGDQARAVAVSYTSVVTEKSQKSSRKQQLSFAQTAPTIESVLAQTRLEAPRHPLDEQIEVAGETYYAKGIKAVFNGRSMPITTRGSTLDDLQCVLMPEPWNPHDPNAVAVLIDGQQVGHLPADVACDYAVPLGQLAARGFLATGEARIWAKSDGGVVRARVTLLIPEASSF